MEEMRTEEGSNPMRATDWSVAYSRFLFLYDRPRPVARKQSVAAPVSKLTYEEVDGWSGERLRKELERSPARAAEIESVLSRKS